MTEPETIPPKPTTIKTAAPLNMTASQLYVEVSGDLHIVQRSWLRDAMDARNLDLLGAMCVIGFGIVFGAGTAAGLLIFSGSVVRRLLGGV